MDADHEGAEVTAEQDALVRRFIRRATEVTAEGALLCLETLCSFASMDPAASQLGRYIEQTADLRAKLAESQGACDALLTSWAELRTLRDAALARATEAERELQDARDEVDRLLHLESDVRQERDALAKMLQRAVKYAREDRMTTPGVTRLQRVLDAAEKALEGGGRRWSVSKRILSDRCKHCGMSKAEHDHAFEPALVPKGCMCDPTTWRDNEPSNAICDGYMSPDYLQGGNCVRCEHEDRCHAEGGG